MKIIGLTGSIGMGKSFVADIFRSHDIAVFDADATIHQLTKPGGEAEDKVLELFPEARGEDGHINRPMLGMMVFSDESKLRALEQLLHPLLRQKGDEFYTKCEAQGRDIMVQDIPLLFETGADATCHVVIVVTAPEDIQAERVLSRENMSEEKYNNIKQFQLTSKEKCERADYVIHTDMDKDVIEDKVQDILDDIRAMAIS